jgi:hypothetical protein
MRRKISDETERLEGSRQSVDGALVVKNQKISWEMFGISSRDRGRSIEAEHCGFSP